MTPHQWIVEQRRREDQRRTALAFIGIALMIVALGGLGMMLVALIEGGL